MMGRTKTQVREDVGGCSRLRYMSANLDQVGSIVFLFAFAYSCFSGAPFQMFDLFSFRLLRLFSLS